MEDKLQIIILTADLSLAFIMSLLKWKGGRCIQYSDSFLYRDGILQCTPTRRLCIPIVANIYKSGTSLRTIKSQFTNFFWYLWCQWIKGISTYNKNTTVLSVRFRDIEFVLSEVVTTNSSIPQESVDMMMNRMYPVKIYIKYIL